MAVRNESETKKSSFQYARSQPEDWYRMKSSFPLDMKIDTDTYVVSIWNINISYLLAAGSYQLDTRLDMPILNLTDTTTFVSNSYLFETKMDTLCHFD